MKKAKHIGLIALCLAAVCLICFLFGRSVGKSAGISEVDAVVLENKLTEISELASITYSYTNMAEFENSKDFYGIKLPFTTKGFIITYDEDSLEIFDETTSIFNPLKVTDYNSFNRDQKAEMEKKATEKGLLTEAKKKAADTVKGFILQLVPEDWTVEVA